MHVLVLRTPSRLLKIFHWGNVTCQRQVRNQNPHLVFACPVLFGYFCLYSSSDVVQNDFGQKKVLFSTFGVIQQYVLKRSHSGYCGFQT